jgi:tetratricopeptide (TPR) repeat protein
MNRMSKKTLAVVVSLLVVSSAIFAQAGRGKGRLYGKVVDEKGEPIKIAQVKIEFEKDGLKDTAAVNEKGEYAFIGLGTGQCIVTASADGYLDTFQVKRVSQFDLHQNLDFVLKEDTEKKIRLHDEAALLEIDKGNQLFGERKFDEALAIYQNFATNNPNIFQIYFNIGDVFREKGEFDKANEQYNIAMAKAKEKADVVMQAKALASLGEICLRQEKLKEAQELFTQSIALNPKDEILAYNVAQIFFDRNQTDKAIEYYKLAIQIKPEWSEPYLKLGYAYLNKGDMKQAIVSLNEFLKYNADLNQAAVVKGLIDSLTKTK